MPLSSHTVSPALSNELLFDIDGFETASQKAEHSLAEGLADWTQRVKANIRHDDAPEQQHLETARQRIEHCAAHGTTCLDLSALSLDTLPDNLAQLKHLTHLDLSGNRFSEIPAPLEDMHGLAHVDLARNAIASLPASVPLPIHLERLTLDSNPLHTLPDDLLNRIPRGLRLTCHHTPLTEFHKHSVRLKLGEHFPEDLFEHAINAWAKDVRAASLSRTQSRSWTPGSQSRLGSTPDV